MEDRRSPERRPLEVIEAFDRERARARELGRRHAENMKQAHAIDKQVLIERRKRPR